MYISKSKTRCFRLILITMFVFVVSLTLFSCNSGKDNKQSKVQTIDDLPGAVIGVQLGTTGDIFVSDYEKEDLKKFPMARYGTIDEYGRLATWLCSEANTYVSGQTILLDGAMTTAY